MIGYKMDAKKGDKSENRSEDKLEDKSKSKTQRKTGDNLNEKDNMPDYQKLYRIVSERFIKTGFFCYGPYDETYFSLRVFKFCKIIADSIDEDIDREALLVAAILHDIGKVSLDVSKIMENNGYVGNIRKHWMEHPALGVPIAKKILEDEGHSPGFIEKVSYLIANHAERKKPQEDKTLEEMILQDADLIADIGYAGFIRPFLFAGRFKRSVIDTLRFVRDDPGRIGNLEMINLDVSKRLAMLRQKVQKAMADQISKDIDCELLEK